MYFSLLNHLTLNTPSEAGSVITSIFQMEKRFSKLFRVTLLGDLSPGWLAPESCPLIPWLSLLPHWVDILGRVLSGT